MVALMAVTLVTTVAVTFDQCLVYAPSEENVLYGTSDKNGNSYVYFESRANAGVYKLNDKNKLIASITDSDGSVLNGGKVIDLVFFSDAVNLAVRLPSGFRLFSWDDELSKRTEKTFLFKGDVVVTGFGAGSDSLQIATIEDEGTTAAVYAVSGTEKQPVNLKREDAPEGVRFLDAKCANGKLETLMSDGTRTPGYENSTAEKTVLPENVGFIGITMGFSTVVRNVLIMAAVIFMIAFFFRSVVFKRNYVWLKIYGFMIIVSLCLASAVYLVTEPVNRQRVEERIAQTEYILDVYGRSLGDYDGSVGTARYDSAYNTMSGRWWDTTYTIADMCIVSINNHRALVTVSTDLPYGEWLSNDWGDDVDNCIVRAHSSNEPAWGKSVIHGVNYLAVVDPITDDAGSRSFIAALIRYEDILAENVKDVMRFVLYMLAVWGAALFFIIFVSFKRDIELRSLTKTLGRVIRGEQVEVIKPRTASRDFEGMWNAAAQLSKGMGKNNYQRNQTLAMVSRFAPHNIEKLFGKDSLTDVRLGDKGSINGTVALIKVARPFIKNRNEYMEAMSRYIDILCKYKNDFSGILISDSSTMCSSRMLFPKDDNASVSFAIRASEAIRKAEQTQGKRSLILLHKTDYEFGITGSQDQNYACINSTQLDLISGFVQKLMDLGLRVVASEEALAGNREGHALRYIGYLELPEKAGNIRLYEVLDATSPDERNRKKDTLSVFGKALDLYYDNDFYLARNLFAEAVKDCPEDLVARWYLFKCETMLDEGTVEKFGYGLLSD